MKTVHAYAAHETNGRLEPFEYELGDLGGVEVDIEVESCGICHSDLSMLEGAWGRTPFPLVPGHEIVGKIVERGDLVTHLSVGDRVGIGWHSGYCMTCEQCLSGHHNLCREATATIIRHHGGFADLIRAQAASVVKIPDGIEAGSAGPLLCGGATVFHPLLQHELPSDARVAVIGIGGLGHMALRFARAWGCEVTAFTSSEEKMEEALELGAHETIHSRNEAEIARAKGRFDLVISTVNVSLDWNAYLATLRPRGILHFVGAVMEPVSFSLMPLIVGQKSISASPVGSPATVASMLDFAVRHSIAPVTEHFPLDQVNEAIERLRSGAARYRIVLDRSS